VMLFLGRGMVRILMHSVGVWDCKMGGTEGAIDLAKARENDLALGSRSREYQIAHLIIKITSA
jgi:hypothetical protein